MKVALTIIIIILLLLSLGCLIRLPFYSLEEKTAATKRRMIIYAIIGIIGMIASAILICVRFKMAGAVFLACLYTIGFIEVLLTIVWIAFCAIMAIIYFLIVHPIILLIRNLIKKDIPRLKKLGKVYGIVYGIILILYLTIPIKYPFFNPHIMGRQYNGIVRAYGEPTYNDGDVICYRGGCFLDEFNYYCIQFNESGRACRVYYTKYDEEWILGRSLEEVNERFPDGDWWGRTRFYHVSNGHSGTWYAVDFDENDIAIDFQTADAFP